MSRAFTLLELRDTLQHLLNSGAPPTVETTEGCDDCAIRGRTTLQQMLDALQAQLDRGAQPERPVYMDGCDYCGIRPGYLLSVSWNAGDPRVSFERSALPTPPPGGPK